MELTPKTKEKISREFQAILQHARGLMEATSGEVDEKTKVARDRLQQSLDNLKDRYHNLEESFYGGVESTDRIIREKPYHALGITLGVGVLLGLLFKRK